MTDEPITEAEQRVHQAVENRLRQALNGREGQHHVNDCVELKFALRAYGRSERAAMPCYRGSCEMYQFERLAMDGFLPTEGLCLTCQARSEEAATP